MPFLSKLTSMLGDDPTCITCTSLGLIFQRCNIINKTTWDTAPMRVTPTRLPLRSAGVSIPEIKTPADLKGKRVGVTRIGAVSQVVLLMMLQRWKMSPSDVQVMQVGSSPNMLVSLDKKGIEAAVLTIPSMFVAEDRGYRVLIDMADTDIFYLHTMIATTRNYIKNNRDKVLRFLKGYLEGLAFVKQHKKESIDVVKKKLR